MATSEHWKDKTTNERLADVAGQYLKNGSKVYIEGGLRTRKWKDQNGVDRETTEIRADVLQLL